MWLIESLLRARGCAVRPGPLSVVGGMARRGHQSPPVTAPVPRYCADSPACSLLRCVWRFVPRRVSASQWWRQAQGPDRGDTSQPQWCLRSAARAALPPPERCKGRHSLNTDLLRWAENRSLRSVFILLRIEERPVSAADAMRRTRSIPPPVMSFLHSAYLVGGRTPHQPSSQVRHSLAQCLRPSLLPRAHPSRRPLPSEPRHHRSSRRSARFVRAGRPRSAWRLGRSAPGCWRVGPGRLASVGLVAG